MNNMIDEKRVFNFSAGPAKLPELVLKKIRKELFNWNNLGISIMEVSHRSKEFIKLTYDTKKIFRELLNIPINYKILFCHGGARAQFSAIPMNLLKKPSDQADYVNTGYWSYNAAIEAKKFCNSRIVDVTYNDENNFRSIKSVNQWDLSLNSSYIHYCPNETVDGISINEVPNFFNKTIVADCSSILLSSPLDVTNFGIIYAAAQKNIGIPGLTILIIREDLIKKTRSDIPSILSYQILNDHDSMFNTPVTISWYIANLICQWIQEQGGLQEINKYNLKKALLLYNAIDENDFYYNKINLFNRSIMNVSFFLKNNELYNVFFKEALHFGLYGLRGHRAIGGIRASLYNAMTLQGVLRLIKFMRFFSKKYG